MLLYALSFSVFTGFDEFRAGCLSQDKNSLRTNLLKGLFDSGDNINENGIEQSEFFNILYSSGLLSETKLAALDVYENSTQYYNELLDIIEPFVDCIIKCGSIYSDIVQELSNEFDSIPSQIDILKEFYGTENINEKAAVVFPALFTCGSTNLLSVGKAPQIELSNALGVLMLKLRKFKPVSLSNEEIHEILKLLSDKSRFEILRMLGSETLYGKKIANEMNLTTATVYHHLNKLVMFGLVSVDISASRPYYSLKRDKLEKFLRKLTDILLEKP